MGKIAYKSSKQQTFDDLLCTSNKIGHKSIINIINE